MFMALIMFLGFVLLCLSVSYSILKGLWHPCQSNMHIIYLLLHNISIAFDTEPNKGKQSDSFGSQLLGWWDWDWRLHPSPDMNYTWNETPVQHWIYELGAQFWWLFMAISYKGDGCHGIFVAMIASGGHPSTRDGMKNLHQTAGHRSDRKIIHSFRKTWEKAQRGAVEVRNGQIYGYKILPQKVGIWALDPSRFQNLAGPACVAPRSAPPTGKASANRVKW